MIDRTAVKERLARIGRSVDRLARLATVDRREFLNPDGDYAAIAESHLRRSLEAVFDVGRHILAKSGHGDMAQEYKSIATGLVRLNIVPVELESNLVNMAGYRNRLVHLYHEINDEELYEIISENLDDFRHFVRSVKSYIDELPQ